MILLVYIMQIYKYANGIYRGINMKKKLVDIMLLVDLLTWMVFLYHHSIPQ